MSAIESSVSAPAASRPSSCRTAATFSGRADAAITISIAPSRPDAQSGAPAASAAVSETTSGSRSNTGTCVRAKLSCSTVACEHDPASAAAAPASVDSAPRSVGYGNGPVSPKFAGTPIATPEPPVISGCAAAASPIATR